MAALIADKGYDGDGFRAEIANRGARPVIPNKSNRVALHSFSKRAYKGRNVIERCFCRLKDFRRIATRYDKLARNFLAAVQLAAVVAYYVDQPPEERVRALRYCLNPRRAVDMGS
jgi:transposase